MIDNRSTAAQLEDWLEDPAVRISHHRTSTAAPDRLWRAALEIELRDTRVLGRLVRWRIPGVRASTSFEELFRCPPFSVLVEGEYALISGLVGRIWTLRRDYPRLEGPEEFREWSRSGTAKVLIANWVEANDVAGSVLRSEARIKTFGPRGRIGLTSLRPLINGFQHLVASDALAAVVRAAERG